MTGFVVQRHMLISISVNNFTIIKKMKKILYNIPEAHICNF